MKPRTVKYPDREIKTPREGAKRFPYPYMATAEECRCISDAELLHDREAYHALIRKNPREARLALKRHGMREHRLSQTYYKTVGVIFERTEADELAKIAKGEGISQSELVRRAVRHYIRG